MKQPEFEDGSSLHCSACGESYSSSAPKVQRGLKQVMGLTRSKQDPENCKLCWVCVRLRESVKAEKDPFLAGWGEERFV